MEASGLDTEWRPHPPWSPAGRERLFTRGQLSARVFASSGRHGRHTLALVDLVTRQLSHGPMGFGDIRRPRRSRGSRATTAGRRPQRAARQVLAALARARAHRMASTSLAPVMAELAGHGVSAEASGFGPAA